MNGRPTAAASEIVGWLVDQALATPTVAAAFEGFVLRLRDAGVALDRAHLAYTTLHPLHRGSGATWRPDGGLEVETYAYDRDQASAGWYRSPIHHAVKNRVPTLRRRLVGPGATTDFEVLEDFAAEGLTDYYLLCCPFQGFYAPVDIDVGGEPAEGSGLAVSFATSRESGFSDEEIETLCWLLKPFAAVVKMADQRQVALNLAECYIGKRAGPRVLGGAIQRGDFASTRAVVFMADLRASTELASELPRDEFVAAINSFFDCAVTALEAEGGEPLTFIGDGVLAIFPIETLGEEGARRAAHRAVDEAVRALNALNEARIERGQRPLRWGMGLHAGELEYGNIGAPSRHSWTAIGAVVNETARLEALTKEVGEPVVASRAFVEGLGPENGWRRLGAYDLKGVPGAFEAFAPPFSVAAEYINTEQEAV